MSEQLPKPPGTDIDPAEDLHSTEALRLASAELLARVDERCMGKIEGTSPLARAAENLRKLLEPTL